LSRHRKFQLSRTKAILVAAGALSVATAASATAAATWTSGSAGPSGHATGLSAGAHDVPRLAVTYQLASPPADVAYQQPSLTFAQQAAAVRAAQTRDAMAQWTAAQWTASQKRTEQKAEAARRAAAATVAATSAAATSSPSAAPSPSAAAPGPSGSPQRIAAAMLGSFGWPASEFACLDPLWEHESGWSATADNAGTGAYGIPQALPGAKMASAGPDWQTDAATQIKWGLEYIKDTYGSPCAAWDHEQATGWY
jgi:hypothetical protein